MTLPPPIPPRPELLRSPRGSFGWLEDRLLHEQWLARIGTDASALLLLLALAADRHGASFFSRARMASALGVDLSRVDSALTRLRSEGLIDHRPWRCGARDGVWQLLPIPQLEAQPRTLQTLSMHAILARLGLKE